MERGFGTGNGTGRDGTKRDGNYAHPKNNVIIPSGLGAFSGLISNKAALISFSVGSFASSMFIPYETCSVTNWRA